MSRPLRIEYQGAWYHVMNRGRRKEAVFLSPDDYATFLTVLQEASSQWNLQVGAYCLMPNHYHLLVQTPDGNLSRCMRHVNGVYTQRFNRCHDFDGQLFRGRYKAILIAEDHHLLEVLRYIHRNPLEGGLVERLDQYPWSSHQRYLDPGKKEDWLARGLLLSMLTSRKSRQTAAYREFVDKESAREITSFYAHKNLPSLLGDQTFTDWVKTTFQESVDDQEVPEAQRLAPSAEQVMTAVCGYFQIEQEQLTRSRRGHENMARDLAIYLVRVTSHDTLATIGAYFRIQSYSTVSSVVERVRRKIGDELQWRRHHDAVMKQIKKGQRQT